MAELIAHKKLIKRREAEALKEQEGHMER